MPRSQHDRKQLTSLEAQQRKLHERILAERRALASKNARRRTAARLAHEQMLFQVLRRFALEAITPPVFDTLLRRAGLARKARHYEEHETGEGLGIARPATADGHQSRL